MSGRPVLVYEFHNSQGYRERDPFSKTTTKQQKVLTRNDYYFHYQITKSHIIFVARGYYRWGCRSHFLPELVLFTQDLITLPSLALRPQAQVSRMPWRPWEQPLCLDAVGLPLTCKELCSLLFSLVSLSVCPQGAPPAGGKQLCSHRTGKSLSLVGLVSLLLSWHWVWAHTGFLVPVTEAASPLATVIPQQKTVSRLCLFPWQTHRQSFFDHFCICAHYTQNTCVCVCLPNCLCGRICHRPLMFLCLLSSCMEQNCHLLFACTERQYRWKF